MAVTPVRSKVPQTVSVALPRKDFNNLDNVNKIVAATLGRLGCPACFSGFDLRFRPGDLVVNPRTFEVDQLG
ncbi:MAG TPA: hypothetical protein VEW26_04085 [Allosphingosinicella sp.]|nr:hypothetical protein [Allosphingosinicella sp.]